MQPWKRLFFAAVVTLSHLASHAVAKPYPEEDGVPDGEPVAVRAVYSLNDALDAKDLRANARAVMRVDVRWNSNTDTFQIQSIEREQSGTDAFVAAARFNDPHGSFKARLVDTSSNQTIAYSVMGTGFTFKHLARVITFRFPLPNKPVRFELEAEESGAGRMEKALSQDIALADIKDSPVTDVEVRLLRAATRSPKLIINVYAEGYADARREVFFQEARKVPAALEQGRFPKQEHMEFRAVFAPSRTAIGKPQNLGLPVPARDSFLGLYFPYWHDFGRYYHVVYPTSTVKYRRALASAPYDYPIALVDDDEYWGVGNFKELTAIPSRSSKFNYLLAHEFGHFFGLNEEYDHGGATELAFAPDIEEPWSQNITFQSERESVKWKRFINASTPVPTPASTWRAGQYGLYAGGYAETPKPGAVFKPGRSCTMDTGSSFCSVCSAAIEERIEIDLGLKSSPNEGGDAGSCSCRAENATTCALYSGSEKVAWATLHTGASCDETFCSRHFLLARKNACQ